MLLCNKNLDKILYCLLFAFIVITVCSRSSFLYPFNDLSDGNCYMSVGKGMLYGKVPYRDLYDHKGPLIYYLHALACLISETSFLGVYFIEIIAASLFLYYAAKLCEMFNINYRCVIPVLSAFIYTSKAFIYGDTAEELCLPSAVYCLYIGFKYIRNNYTLENIDCIKLGVALSFVFWLKFNLIGIFIGTCIFIVITSIYFSNNNKFVENILCFGCGFTFITCIVLAYFIYNEALYDLLKVYFYDNLFTYNNVTDVSQICKSFENLWLGFATCCHFFMIPFALAFLGAGFFKNKKIYMSYYFMTFILSFVVLFVGGRNYFYYAFIMGAFSVFGLLYIREYLGFCCKLLNKNILIAVSVLAGMIIPWVMSPNVPFMQKQKNNLVQFKFKNIIMQKENPTLQLYKCMDEGFYTVCGIVPRNKYFIWYNMPKDEINYEQDQYIRQGKVDYVITREQFSFTSYVLVAQEINYDGSLYYLYKRNCF